MCLIFFAYNYHPRYQLIVAANRDEFYKRPSLPAAFWRDNPTILAGRDLEQGGTWMGLTTTGCFAALTNYRDPVHNNPQAPSRGYLVHKYLNSDVSPEYYLKNLPNGGAEYNGFNLLVGTTQAIYYYSNREKVIRKIANGIYGLSNGFLNEPWPKVSKGKKALADCLQGQEIKKDQLFKIMADQEQPEDCELPQTGVSLEWERLLSRIFIVSPCYGTRSSTVLMVDRKGHVQFWERSFTMEQPGRGKEVFHEFNIKG
ncbi:NRDE family protein [Desulforamulus reducens]|nr:NRDE family protein [Desulforamulus reducens]